MELQEPESMVEELIDELVPEGLDWQRLVVRYPLSSLLVAVVGGFYVGRKHGPEILKALSGIAAAEVSRHVGHLLDYQSE
jgi:hypothetical protein